MTDAVDVSSRVAVEEGEVLTRTLAMFQRLYGGDHPRWATSLTSLAHNLRALGSRTLHAAARGPLMSAHIWRTWPCPRLTNGAQTWLAIAVVSRAMEDQQMASLSPLPCRPAYWVDRQNGCPAGSR
jgi:hypothetical protein